MKDNYIAVIGASNIDIGGTPYAPLIKADSNPGSINISYGGVGRNISHNLCRLGLDVKLITAAGSDHLGHELIRYCNDEGIDTSCSAISEDINSSLYLYINNSDGEMELALSDMDVCKIITPEYIDSVAEVIGGAAIAAADCNLPQDTLMHIRDICNAADVPLFIDPVSVNKSYKIKGNLEGVYAIKPNIIEASYLTDIDIRSRDDCILAARELIRQGIKNVFISMGADGILAADSDEYYFAPIYESNASDICTTGAGDASAAAIIWAYYKFMLNNSAAYSASYDHADASDILRLAAKAANAASSITLDSPSSVSPHLSEDRILSMISEIDD